MNMNHLQYASFVAMGFGQSPGYDSAVAGWFREGVIELVQNMTGYVPFMCDLINTGFMVEGSLPGVAEYEVAMVFGAWFGVELVSGDRLGMPSNDACEKILRSLVVAFFERDDGERAELRKAVAALPMIVS